MLIAARAFQGLGGGALISLGQTIIGDIVAPAERGRYQAYFATVFVTSSVGGPVLGGFFAEYLHWSFIFWINLPLGLAAWLLTNNVLRRLPRNEQPHRIDILGALLMLAATVSLLLALTFGGTSYAWSSPQILGLFVASAAGWALFGWRLVTAAEPFIPLNVLSHQVVRNGVGALFFAVGSLVGLSVFMPLYFEAELGLSAAGSGTALIALMGGAVAGATLAGRIMARFAHYKRVSVIGLALATLVTLVLATFPTSLPFFGVEIVLAVIGIGIGTVFPITVTAVQNAVPLRQLGTTTGLLNFCALARRCDPGTGVQRHLSRRRSRGHRPRLGPDGDSGGQRERHRFRQRLRRRVLRRGDRPRHRLHLPGGDEGAAAPPRARRGRPGAGLNRPRRRTHTISLYAGSVRNGCSASAVDSERKISIASGKRPSA